MKKLFMIWSAIFAMTVAVISPTASYASSPNDFRADQDAFIPPHLYSSLYQNAGLVTYVDVQKELETADMRKAFRNGEYKEYSSYTIGTPSTGDYSNKLLITNKGLFVLFNDKALSAGPNNPSVEENADYILQQVVKTVSGFTMARFAHFNFNAPAADKLVYLSPAENNITFSSDAKIDEIVAIPSYGIGVETLSNNLFSPGYTHKIDYNYNDLLVDGIISNTAKKDDGDHYGSSLNLIAISYSGSSLSVSDPNGVQRSFNLKNQFIPQFKDISTSYYAYKDIMWAVKNGVITGYADSTFKPGNPLKEGDFVRLLARYYNALPTEQYGKHSAQPFYDVLQAYRLPLKGYANDSIKEKAITRATLAQVLSASQGGPSDARGAVQWIYDKGLSTGKTGSKTYEDFAPNETLKRGEIAAFFNRMATKGMTDLTK